MSIINLTKLLLVVSLLSAGTGAAHAQSFDTSSLNSVSAVIDTALPLTVTATLGGGGPNLPVVSTGSVDLNTCDMPFLRSRGGAGAFPGAGGGDGGSGGGAGGTGGGMPALPPGYIGVQNTHNGSFMGAIPPGGNIVDFFSGAYGIQPGQEAEADYILHNQLRQLWSSGAFAGLWGQYENSGPP